MSHTIMNPTQSVLIEQELRGYILTNRSGRLHRAFVTEISKPEKERDIPQLKREVFDLFDKVINDLYMGQAPKVE